MNAGAWESGMGEAILGLTTTGGVAEITLNRPAQLNAVNCELAERLVDALATIAHDRTIKVVVLKGAGRAFMAGGDLKEFHDAGEHAQGAVQRLIVPFHRIIRAIRELGPPVIASVHGAVAGGGLALALACDYVIAAADTVFTPAYLRIATNPDGGTTWSVTRLLGERRALEWLMLGDPIKAHEAAAIGLINRVVAREALDDEVGRLAQRIVVGPAQAQASLKRLIWRAAHSPINDQLEAEAAGFLSLSATADFREGVAAFFERREPRFER
jgi:2-(1,2-epoxy-1,2-dihydrophenyl)acetyl-CoA isomerase